MPTEATVTLPGPLAEVANRIAVEQHWSFPEAVVFLVKRGVKAQQEAERTVAESYDRFMNSDADAQQKNGDDLMRAIFGPESVA
ncbi:MAG TPA: hypothetical protein VHZ07_02495 [Bryobacteraceae bacterium]|nr:hypothetical protein [Bryobacteraceae bacterium]